MEAGNYVSSKQAAQLLGISVSTVYRMVKKGVLTPSKTPGGQRRFDRVDVVQLYKGDLNDPVP